MLVHRKKQLNERRNWLFQGFLFFQSLCVHASKAWRCRTRVTASAAEIAHVGLTSPAFHACGSATPFRARCRYSQKKRRPRLITLVASLVAATAIAAAPELLTCSLRPQSSQGSHCACTQACTAQLYALYCCYIASDPPIGQKLAGTLAGKGLVQPKAPRD